MGLIKLHCEAGTILEHMELFEDIKRIIGSMEFVGTYFGEDAFAFDPRVICALSYREIGLGEFKEVGEEDHSVSFYELK